MTNLLATIAPKSDQLNADDLIGRSLTIKVTKVSLCGEPDQPIAVHYEGDGGKPYKPCKSMRRVMVHVWGGDGNTFAGRRMALYRDDKVTFGKDAVGGIRISHMSDIDRDVTMALTVTRANRRPYTVKPLPPEKADPTECVDLLTVLTEGRAAAQRGSAALTAWWGRLDRDEKAAAKPTLDSELKAAATSADQAALDDTHTDFDAETPSAPASNEPASDGPPQPRTDAGDTFPGDSPSAGESETASPAEPNGDEGTGLAVDVIAWADKLIDDLPFLKPEQVAAVETDRRELAKFAILRTTDLAKARELEAALQAAKES